MSFVTQEWLKKLSLKEQTILLCSLRGTDSYSTKNLKRLTRWFRSIILVNADPSGRFMRVGNIPSNIKPLCEEPSCETIPNAIEVDMLSVHYYSHLMHALQIIGYKHSDRENSDKALSLYRKMVDYLHLKPETKEEMDNRLQDKNGV